MRTPTSVTTMNIRQRSRMVMLTGLLVLLTACTTSPSPQAGHTPTVNVSIPTPMATAQPEPSPPHETSPRLYGQIPVPIIGLKMRQ